MKPATLALALLLAGTTPVFPGAIPVHPETGAVVVPPTDPASIFQYVQAVLRAVNTALATVYSTNAPTISAGGCTTGTAQSVAAANGTIAFAVTLGGATCGNTITFTVANAPNGWVCEAHDVTTPASNVIEQSATTVNTVTLTKYVRTTGVAGPLTAADSLLVKCSPY